MRFLKFIKDHLSAILGHTVGVIGIALSIYFYMLSIAERQPILLITEPRTLVADAARTVNSRIQVLRSDGSPISGQVWAAQFYLWNAGKISINRANVLAPITIEFADSSVELLGYSVVNESRPEISRAALVADDKSKGRAISIDFQILENRDVVIGQVIYQGTAQSPINIQGTVEGVEEILTNPPVDWSAFWLNIGVVVGVSVLAVIGMGASLLITAHLHTRVSKNEKLTKVVKYAFNAALILSVGFLFWAMGSTFYKRAATQKPPQVQIIENKSQPLPQN